MTPLLLRLLLLLLLLCDWAFDPYHGRSPLSRPLSSQEVTCFSLALRADSHPHAREEYRPLAAFASPEAPPLPHPRVLTQAHLHLPSPAGAELVYDLGRLRR